MNAVLWFLTKSILLLVILFVGIVLHEGVDATIIMIFLANKSDVYAKLKTHELTVIDRETGVRATREIEPIIFGRGSQMLYLFEEACNEVKLNKGVNK